MIVTDTGILARPINEDESSFECIYSASKVPIVIDWGSIIFEADKAEGSKLEIKDSSLPVRTIVDRLIKKFAQEIEGKSIDHLAPWLMKEEGNSLKAVAYTKENWDLNEFDALGAVLFIRQHYKEIVIETRVPDKAISEDVEGFKCVCFGSEVPIVWGRVISEVNTVEGSILEIKDFSLPVRIVAGRLIHKFAQEIVGESIDHLVSWLNQPPPKVGRENTLKAVDYAKSAWNLSEFKALGTVLFIRQYPDKVKEDIRQEETYYTKAWAEGTVTLGNVEGD